MVSALNDNKDRIEEICRRFGVKRLFVFGSATRKSLLKEIGDLDFVVEFGDVQPGKYADSYFGLMEGLERLFDIDVDLIEAETIDNPYLKKAIEESKVPLYDFS